MEEESVSKKLDKLIDLNIQTLEEKKEKKFSLPWGIKLFSKGKLKKNYAIVQILRTNGSVEFKFVQIEDNTIKIGDVYHEATADYIMRYKKYPLIVLPEWNIRPIKKGSEEMEVQPFKARENIKEAIDKGQLSSAEKFILYAIKMDLVKGKNKVNWMTVLLIGAILVGGYLLAGQMGYV